MKFNFLFITFTTLTAFFSLTSQASQAVAFEPEVSMPSNPSHTLRLPDNIEIEREYYGELTGFPHLYEVTLKKSQRLVVTLYTPADEEPDTRLSGIVVKVESTGGVSEIGRLSAVGNEWESYKQPYSGEQFLKGPTLESELGQGTYRLEVNSPDNQGTYLLAVGFEEQESGYFELISEVSEVKAFLGHSPLSVVFTSLILAPVGILVMLLVFYLTWRARKRNYHAT